MTSRCNDSQVRASLIAMDRSVQPSQTVTVALRLDHEAHWHTYWVNAGSGYPTSLHWELPEGWTAGAIQWPTPLVIMDDQGDVAGNGYCGVLYLPVMLTPPKGGRLEGAVTLKAVAKWLMCGEVCVPSQAEVSLTLPVSIQTPEPDLAMRAELAKMPMPQAPPADWKIVAIRDADRVVLRVSMSSISKAPGSPHFFSEDGFIQYNAEQTSVMADGALSLTLPIADDADSTTQNLVGVLAYNGCDGLYRGVIINAAFDPVPDPQLK